MVTLDAAGDLATNSAILTYKIFLLFGLLVWKKEEKGMLKGRLCNGNHVVSKIIYWR